MTTTFSDTYEIKSLIGKGGMSSVYLAQHRRLGNRWAVKEVRKQGVQFDFLAESNILKRLQHPMLPRIVDIFEDPERVLIVEDFVEGVTLDEVLRRQRKVDEATGRQWFRDLAGVLQYLHTQRPNPIIYRDMKPSNIMLQPDGSLKLIDFGIAREYKQQSSADTTYIGTKGYAAPEQFGRAQTDARTDIYSLGVTMYHLLTGKSPYEPPYQFVPARQLAPELSHGMEYILNKCVQPEPADRYQSVEELLYDLEHSYRFDKAWKKYRRTKWARRVVFGVMLAASLTMTGLGWLTMGQEKNRAFFDLLSQAEEIADRGEPYANSYVKLVEARKLVEDRDGMMDKAYQQYYDYVLAYTQYKNGQYDQCVDTAQSAIENHEGSGSHLGLRAVLASAQFELNDYKSAAEGFAASGELSADNLRDYAVCLGRLGQIEEAERVLDQLAGQGARPDVTQYVQGEVYLAQKEYLDAEQAFLSALEQSDDSGLTRRCYISLGDLYRDCAALARVNQSPVEDPATKSAQLLSQAIATEGLRHDGVLWEMLAQAYYESYHTDPNVPPDYLTHAAECFQQVLNLGVSKEYLYTNLFTIYREQKDYAKAEETLQTYEERFSSDYMPHALRGIMLIEMEGTKPENQRDYHSALQEYETAGDMIRSSDETTYYQQLGSLIDSLRRNGWL